MRTRRVTVLGVLVLLVAGVAVVALVVAGALPRGASEPTAADPEVVGPTTTPGATPSDAPTEQLDPCRTQPGREVRPTSISTAGVEAAVLALPRDANDVPGVPPLTSEGKQQVAWDPARLPGAPAGNVLLNAHTWPDGTALGNRLLERLDVGGAVRVHGKGGALLCYRVTRRIEVPATSTDSGYYDTDGPPQLALIACSGVRRGPGDWTHRTIWFAEPVGPR